MKFLLKLRPLLLVAVFSFFLIAVPTDLVLAQSPEPTGLVSSCSGPDCSLCNLVDMANTIIRWLFGIIFLIFAVIMFVAGIGLVTSGGNQSALDAAKSKFQNALIGILIIMAAWLVVNRIMTGLLADGAGSTSSSGLWNEIECQVQVAPQVGTTPTTPTTPGAPTTPTTPGTPTTPPGTIPPNGCENCTAVPSNIPTNGNACNPGAVCQLRPDMTARLTAAELAVNGLRVSEAWPPTGATASDPTGVHRSECHANATCVDVSFNQNNPSGTQVEAFINNARGNNLTAQYEVQTTARQQQLQAAGVSNVIVVPGSREHFSVYMCDVDNRANACR